jgi:hypothetical protein
MNSFDRLTISAMAIVHLQTSGEITEGQAKILMNNSSLVEYRITRDRLEKEMRDILRSDMLRHGWRNLE